MNFEEQKEKLKKEGIKFKTRTVSHTVSIDTRLFTILSEEEILKMEENKISNITNYNIFTIQKEYEIEKDLKVKSFMIFPKVEIEKVSKIVHKKYILKIIIITE